MPYDSPSQRYADYLQSDYWKRVSDAVKAKSGYRCQVCNSPHDLQAHHRTYEHRGKELEHIDDLTCLCRRCHGIFHGHESKSSPAPTVAIPQPQAEVMVLITEKNHKRLKCTKDPWHWMRAQGINPKQSGWARRAIGHTVPARFMHGGF